MRCLVLIGTMLVTGMVGRSAAAQDVRSDLAADRAPRFLLASSPVPVRIDVSRTPVLLRRIAVDLRDASIEEALAAISEQAGLRFMYSKAMVPVDRTVRLRAEDITVAAALTEVLLGAEIDVLFSATGQAALVPRSAPARKPARRLVGILTGQVTDAETNQPVRSAQVLVVGTPRGALTDDEGRYTVAGVPAGPHEVRVLRVGYASATQPVTITDGATATLDFRLTQSVVTFDEVVVTATGEEQRKRESGVAIGTINPDETDLTVANNLPQLLNGRVPGVSVLQSTGTTGAGSTIRIRGPNSVNLSNDPLLIIDGARVDNSSHSHAFLVGAQAPGRLT
ncbi:MAG: carboxypeptidase-like regulatory domain-containing protein, partial [Gemmatimonadaceae bacterium]